MNKVPQMVPYVLTPIEILGDIADFNNNSDMLIVEVIIKVIDYEGPIYFRELEKRVAAHWGISRIDLTVSDKIFDLCLDANIDWDPTGGCWESGNGELSSLGFTWGADVFWPIKSLWEHKTRSRYGLNYKFKPEHIYPEEYIILIEYILGENNSILIGELIREVAKHLGFITIGDKQREAIIAIYNYMLASRMLEHTKEGLIRLQKE